MSRPSRRRFDTRRIRLLLMLVLGLALQPLMAAYGEMHEAFEHADAAHALASPHVADDIGNDADDDGPGHALAHHAHCCAQPQVFPPGAMSLPAPVAATMPIEGMGTGIRPDARKGTPFRPPIQV